MPPPLLNWTNIRISHTEILKRLRRNGALKPYFNTDPHYVQTRTGRLVPRIPNTPSAQLRPGRKYVVFAHDHIRNSNRKIFGAAILVYKGRTLDAKYTPPKRSANFPLSAYNTETRTMFERMDARERYLYTFTSLDLPRRTFNIPMYRALSKGKQYYTISPMTITSAGYTLNSHVISNISPFRAGHAYFENNAVRQSIKNGKESLSKIRRGISQMQRKDMAIRRIQKAYLKAYYDPKTEIARRRLLREFNSM
jgi:hypothetical protein